jgi:hypothetical protein
MPGLPAGVIFEHRPYDWNIQDCGNPGWGAMVLAWTNGRCQANWCGESFWLPGQLSQDRDWFDPLETTKEDLIAEVESLRKRIESM